MKTAVTGATGFLGRYIVRRLLTNGNPCRCWYRSRESCFQVADGPEIDWIPGELGDAAAAAQLVDGCEAVVHSGLHRAGSGFIGDEGDLIPFAQKNIVGSLELINAARRAGVKRFIFISTCAVHDRILDDRPLDEAHPLWPHSHYGAHKAAVEKFVHSFGYGDGFPICSVRPCGIYGLHHEPRQSRWYDLVHAVRRGEPVTCRGGSKLVHAADVAGAVDHLLQAPANRISGEAFSCCEGYVSKLQVATIAAELSGVETRPVGEAGAPKHVIVCDKLQALGFRFGGNSLLTQTIAELLEH